MSSEAQQLTQPVQRSNDFAAMLNPAADRQALEALFAEERLNKFMESPSEINKLMAYYSLSEQQHDTDRFAIVLSLLISLNQNKNFKELYEKIGFSAESSSFLNIEKLTTAIDSVQTQELKGFLSENILVKFKTNNHFNSTPYTSLAEGDAKSHDIIYNPQSALSRQAENPTLDAVITSQSMIAPRTTAESDTQLVTDVKSRIAEYKKLFASINKKKDEQKDGKDETSEELEIEIAQPNNFNTSIATSRTSTLQRPTADFSEYQAKSEDDKAQIIAADILIKIGLSQHGVDALLKIKDAKFGLYNLAYEVLGQSDSLELNIGNMSVFFRAIDIQVNKMLGQAALCSKQKKILGLISKSPKKIRKILNTDIELISDGCVMFNSCIEKDHNTDALLQHFILAAKVFSYDAENPKMTLDELNAYEASIPARITKRSALSSQPISIITKLGIKLS